MTEAAAPRRGANVLPTVVGLALCASLWAAAPAHADLESLKATCVTRDALDDDTSNGNTLPYRFCDDGVPDQGGRTPNQDAVKAVAVPQLYDGVAGLPDKVLPPEPNTGADSNGDIALDIDVSLPDRKRFPPPRGGYPLVVLMHGCCGGKKSDWESDTIEDADSERWHYSNAWFASRGYVVLTYTARGFVSSDETGNRGSTGETQLDDVRYEINDYQSLAAQLADDRFFNVDPDRVVPTGGSYGGGFSWLALTDPRWESPEGQKMKVAVVAVKYGWTDLVQALVPNGQDRRDDLRDFDGSDSLSPLGFPKQSINAGLYVAGKFGVPPVTSSHATFPEKIDQAQGCLTSPADPTESNPACTSTIQNLLPEFIEFRSAYYQQHFFDSLRNGKLRPVPLYSAGTFADPLFPMPEHRRMVERLKRTVDGYPVQEFYGDYEHFSQDKTTEWGDLCGDDRHRCEYSDYPNGNLNRRPDGLWVQQGQGPTMRLNRFVDHYARPQGNPSEARPSFDVTASLQNCPENATEKRPAELPGKRFTAGSFDRLAPHHLRIGVPGTQVTTNKAAPNDHAVNSDPIENEYTNAKKCPVETSPAGPGVATYNSPVLPRAFTMIGQTRITAQVGSGSARQLNGRLYDLFPDGRAVLVNRGTVAIDEVAGEIVFDLFGAGWRFPKGHRIRIELAQDNSPYIKASSQASALALTGVTLDLPVREPSLELGQPSPAAAGPEQTAAGGDLPVELPDLPDLPLPGDVGSTVDDVVSTVEGVLNGL